MLWFAWKIIELQPDTVFALLEREAPTVEISNYAILT